MGDHRGPAAAGRSGAGDDLTPTNLDHGREQGHRVVIEQARGAGVLVAAEPLAPTTSATTVRVIGGRSFVIDGPFAKTNEQLAGYYILECRHLDEAIDWAQKLPTACGGGVGSVEIRPMRFQ